MPAPLRRAKVVQGSDGVRQRADDQALHGVRVQRRSEPRNGAAPARVDLLLGTPTCPGYADACSDMHRARAGTLRHR